MFKLHHKIRNISKSRRFSKSFI